MVLLNAFHFISGNVSHPRQHNLNSRRPETWISTPEIWGRFWQLQNIFIQRLLLIKNMINFLPTKFLKKEKKHVQKTDSKMFRKRWRITRAASPLIFTVLCWWVSFHHHIDTASWHSHCYKLQRRLYLKSVREMITSKKQFLCDILINISERLLWCPMSAKLNVNRNVVCHPVDHHQKFALNKSWKWRH